MNTRTKWGIATMVAAAISGAVYLMDRSQHTNYLEFDLSKFTASGDIFAAGDDTLYVAKGQPFQMNYNTHDTDGLTNIIIYDDEENPIMRHFVYGRGGHIGTIHYSQSNPGEYSFRLVATDTDGNEREGIASLVVEDRENDVPEHKVDFSRSFD